MRGARVVIAAAMISAVAMVVPGASAGAKTKPKPTPTPAPTSFASRVAPDTFGVNGQYVFNMGTVPGYPARSTRGPLLQAMKAAGISFVREDAAWWMVEPNPPNSTDGVNCTAQGSTIALGVPCFYWTNYDDWVTDLANAGLRWKAGVNQTPYWAGIYGGCCNIEPRSTTEFADWVGRLAQRYGVGGTFWAAHPTLPQLPVNVYEIWNEENLSGSWAPAPNPIRYGQMYTAARNAIKAVDSSATVIVGGLSDGANNPGNDFLKTMFLANPGIVVDGVGLHPYAQTAANYISQPEADLHEFRRIMDKEIGIPNVPIYVTEIGRATAGTSPYFETVAEDAANGTPNRREALVRTTDDLTRSNCGVRTYEPYTFYSPGNDPGYSPPLDPNNLEYWFGIANMNGTLKPSGQAWSDQIKLLQGLGPVAPPAGVVGLCTDLGR